jgi:hypothetical protein
LAAKKDTAIGLTGFVFPGEENNDLGVAIDQVPVLRPSPHLGVCSTAWVPTLLSSLCASI